MNQIEQKLEQRLRHTEVENPPFVICFSGTPLSGKSTVAKLLQNRYRMVRIENDMIREILQDTGSEKEAYTVLEKFLEDYSFENKRIVLDSSIDRNYDELIPLLREKGFPVFIINMPIPKDIEKRANEREGENWEEWLSDAQKFIEDTRKAGRDLEYDFRLGEDGGVKKLLEVLDDRL